MLWFRNLKIGKKLGLGFGVIEVLQLALGIFAVIHLSKVNSSTVDIATNWLPGIRALDGLKYDVSVARRGEKDCILANEKKDIEANEAKLNRRLDVVLDDQKRYESLISSGEDRQIYDDFRARWDESLAVTKRVVLLAEQNKDSEAFALQEAEGKAAFEAATKVLQDALDLNHRRVEKAAKEGATTYSSSRYWVIALSAGALVIGIATSVSTSRSLAGAVAKMLAMIQEVAGNNLTISDMEITSQDEIGQAGIALNHMKNNLREMIRSIADTAVHVTSASEQLSGTSQHITANSEETSAQADVVSKAAQQVSQNLQTVAAGAEEMGATIKEIAKNASEAAKVATSAVKVAETTNATVSKLGESSSEIGQVIKVITSIAQQTNLLALNATIEAARAGEAGKGFAVVANEVKELAKETAKATEDISRKIEAIQTDTKAAVGAIATISEIINQINGISSTIATAVEEQNITTNEMARNVSEAARGSGEITQNISGVAEAAQSTTRGAGDTQKAAQQLVEMSTQLRRLVEQFRVQATDFGSRGAEGSMPAKSMAAHAP